MMRALTILLFALGVQYAVAEEIRNHTSDGGGRTKTETHSTGEGVGVGVTTVTTFEETGADRHSTTGEKSSSTSVGVVIDF
ncbi:hypothetical protein [Hoeflea sp.]|uniref:hypothetical protein n=1 Tax=Hoeflea sp. TaxID=1940281 RepID=UPI003B52FB3A